MNEYIVGYCCQRLDMEISHSGIFMVLLNFQGSYMGRQRVWPC